VLRHPQYSLTHCNILSLGNHVIQHQIAHHILLDYELFVSHGKFMITLRSVITAVKSIVLYIALSFFATLVTNYIWDNFIG